MKPVKTKAQIRAEIDAQVNSYLAKGGRVDTREPGESGRSLNAPLPSAPLIERNAQSRTPVLAEIKAIEARRHPVKTHKPKRRRYEERKKLVTDDFGEPLRWIND
ncbi:hypothetical protein HBA55_06555 [Pseudomaricurvus alkylphenolicus]|uniref:hypothetical protein n=1 Tax=Pseudomaricurvus alkylphenolicus TaxID=1306991 RepID=UPI001422B36B|nr:hypothetical protein [Pseudomaricurvus alkylphenolicus]NIB39239.1 hypothetical protein [Pseudomaricurvus alkylphenolicus]